MTGEQGDRGDPSDSCVEVDERRLRALDPALDLESVRVHPGSIALICAGGEDAGPIGRLSQRERFHWLVAPKSALIQTSPVHTGRCKDPAALLEHFMEIMVCPPSRPPPGPPKSRWTHTTIRPRRSEGSRQRLKIRSEGRVHCNERCSDQWLLSQIGTYPFKGNLLRFLSDPAHETEARSMKETPLSRRMKTLCPLS
ncbi:MAG: DUF3037 domain-containing protein [Armatimonadetes bacterium]|nr:DUF3037 domain-containing protein [Armatimonadota bacterium]